MALTKDFERKLNDLWNRRTANIRSLVRTCHGRRKEFSRKARERGIRDLQQIATRILIKQGVRSELAAITRYKVLRHIKGRGLDSKYEGMVGWARKKVRGPIIYVF